MVKKEKIRYDGANPLGVLLYTSAVCTALMYTICREHYIICSLIMCAFTAGLYMLVYIFRKKPLASSLITLGSVGLCALALGSVGTSWAEGSFVHFIFTASTTFNPVYAAVAIVLFSVIISLVCCYFSAVLPRLCFLMLPSFIPLILSARTAGGMPLWLLIPMFGAFVLAVFCSARKCESKDTLVFETASSKQRFAAALCASVLAVGIGTVVPKSSETLLGEFLDKVFIGAGGYNTRNQTLGNFASTSSVNTGNNTLPDNLLFTVQTNIPVLIDRWVFDEYNGSRGWKVISDYNTGYPNWMTYASKRRWSVLFADLIQGAEDGYLEEYADILLELPKRNTYLGEMYIRSVDNTPNSVVLHPLSTYNVEVRDFEGRIYRTPKAEMFTEINLVSAEYLVQYYVDIHRSEYFSAMAEMDFRELLVSACENGVISEVEKNAFLDELNHAEDYFRKTGTKGISSEMQRLADEITEGIENDYEKAVAIENWFGEAEFVYDLEFVPEKAEADYFVFESRRGICSDFATAMTLLARAAGLPARYTEGFSLSDDIRDTSGVYYVTGANAHAYTQIYIEGFGWVNFDATKYALEPTTVSDDWVMSALIIVCLLSVLALLVIIFRKLLARLVFAVTYPVRSKNSCIRGVYLAARELAGDISGREQNMLPCGEVCRILANSLSMPDEAKAICTAADELLYSGNADVAADTKYLYSCLKRLRKQKRRLRK